MSSKWFSRKWLITVFGEIVGVVTAALGALYANQEIVYTGLGICTAFAATYIKGEKDVDAARAGATTVIEDCDCPACNPHKEG